RLGGGYDRFDFHVKSCEVGYAKPELEIYEIAMKHLKGLKPEEVVFTDDRERFLVPARAMGMQAILATSSHQVIRDIHRLLTI
ncbi:MAG TPA: HAD-IA family hydrolase, partial [Candidatus Saccharimonadales bacterium]|nr:HAD-IA family hydrolase [Candidatus Saccharimonadales bacterium]